MRSIGLALSWSLLAGTQVPAADCNQNGTDDALDVVPARQGYRIAGKLAHEGIGQVEMADFDRDGKLEIAAIVFDPPGLDVFVRDDGWKLEKSVSLPLTGQPQDLALGDLDGDGDPDAMVSVFSAVQLFASQAAGLLAERGLIRIGSGVRSLLEGDWNGDGSLDLVTVNRLDNVALDNLSVLLNPGDGSGELLAPRNYATGNRTLAWAAVAADTDGDGDPDVLLVHDGGVLLAVKNDGRGVFTDAASASLDRFGATGMAAGDLDGDSDADLVITDQTPAVTFAWSDGQGSFARGAVLQDGAGDHTALVQDLDGDGRAEVVLPGRDCSTLRVLKNRGVAPGEFIAEGQIFDAGAFSLDRYASLYRARAGDLDGDGDLDLAAASWDGPVLLVREPVGVAADCDRNGVPDECDPDCNGTRLPDACDIALGTSADCDRNAVPDECDPDCDASGTPDACELANGTAADCNANGIPDGCEADDANRNGIPDPCDLRRHASLDCDGNGVPDEADLEPLLAFPHRRIQTGLRQIWTVATGEFDGDGLPDLLASTQQGVFLLRQATRRDSLLLSRATSEGATALAAADFDRDGDLDASFAANGAPCWWEKTPLFSLENLGDGVFRRRGMDLFGSSWSSNMEAADLDEDGIEDLAVSMSSLWLLRGRGDGTFEKAREVFSSYPSPLERGFTLADFDADGDRDLAGAAGGIVWNGGPSGFALGPSFEVDPGNAIIVAGDLDGDLDPDLATSSRVLDNEGGGSFTRRRELPLGLRGLCAGDLDGDGKTDLAVATGEGFCVFLNRGRAFAETCYEVAMAYYVKWIGAQDFDGDRSTDLVLVDGLTGEVSVHTGAGGGDFSAPQVLEERTAILALRAADVNLDGDRDLMVLDSPGVDLRSFLLIRNLGGGVFRSDPPLSLPPETRDLDAFDMDADGDLDAVLCGAEAFLVLPNDRAEGFPRRWEIPVPGAGLEATVAGDLDGDGDGDLVGSAPGEVSLAEQVAPGSFTVRSLFSGTVAGKDLLTGDVDGDGDEDVLAGADTSLQVLKNDGQGDFTAGPPIDVGRTLASALAFDAEADGDLDLALSILIRRGSDCFLDGDCSTLLMVLLNDGGAAFTFAIEYRVPYAAESLASADLDADGDADLVATQSFSSTPSGLIPGAGVELLLNAGDGSFRSWGTLPIGNRPSSIAAADLDGDLYPDLALGTEAGVIVMPLRIIRPRAVDADRNGVVDDCEQTPFRRGDWNRDGALNLTDPIAFLEYLFRGGPGSPCAKAGDTDDGGRLDLADAVRILSHLFQGGPAPRAPFAACGLDPTPDSLSCAAFPPCR